MTYSILIPRVFINTNQNKIKKSFENLNIGIVSHVKFVVKADKFKKLYKNAYVYFQTWFDNDAAINLRNKIEDPTFTAKVVYNDPWYWIVLPNTSPPTVIEHCLEKIYNLEKDIMTIQSNWNYHQSLNQSSQEMYLSDLDDKSVGEPITFSSLSLVSPASPLYEPSSSGSNNTDQEDFNKMMNDSEEKRNKYWMTVNYCGNE